DAEAVHQGGGEGRGEPVQQKVHRDCRRDRPPRPAELGLDRGHEHAGRGSETSRAEDGHECYGGDPPGVVDAAASPYWTDHGRRHGTHHDQRARRSGVAQRTPSERFEPYTRSVMHRVAVLALNDVVAFDLGVPSQVLGAARDAAGRRLYDVRVCTPDGKPIRTSAGFRVVPEHGPEIIDIADTVIVPGADGSALRTHLEPDEAAALARVPAHARLLLETTDLGVDVVARRCGFGSAVSLRQHLHAAVGVSPLAYRRTFRSSPPPDGASAR